METLVYNWIPSDWTELYYSVQSMKRYLKNLDKIYILTNHDLPFSDEQVIRVPVIEEGELKEHILINNVRQFCEMGLCDDFIYCADDHFALREFGRDDITPPMTLEDIKDVAFWDDSLPYWNKLLYWTMECLQERGYQTMNYATHAPELMECKKFIEMTQILEGCTYQIQSGYFNIHAKSYRKLSENIGHVKVFTRPMQHKGIEIITRNQWFLTVEEGALNDDMKKFISEKCTFLPEK